MTRGQRTIHRAVWLGLAPLLLLLLAFAVLARSDAAVDHAHTTPRTEPGR